MPQLEWEIHPGVLDTVWFHVGGPERTSHRAESLEVRRDEFEEVGDQPARVSFSLWLHTPTGAVPLKCDKVYSEPLDHLGQWLGHRLEVPLNRSAIEKDPPKAEPSRRPRAG